jgi:O-acetyl-ADP-ribose deacetylase (regulator of RNase III)
MTNFKLFLLFNYLVTITDAPNLSATHLIHVNSPSWNAGTQAECIDALDKATTNILNLADQQGLTSVALPSISSGKYVELFQKLEDNTSYFI